MSMYARASTDRTTNTVLLDGTCLETDLTDLLTLGRGPRQLLPAFLHESVHHWSNDTPVGLALALMQLDLYQKAAAYQEGDFQADFRIAQVYNRYQAALAFLHAIEEGMALFAEFDLYTGQQSTVWSTPLELAATFFETPKIGHNEPNFASYWAVGAIQPMRLSNELLDRKVNVLGKGLSFTKDAYLAGYLLVRRMWLNAISANITLLGETDLFLMHMSSFLFDDYGLVAALLDDSLDEVRGAQHVVQHVSDRFNQLLENDYSRLDEFQAALQSSGEAVRSGEEKLTAIGVTAADIAAGKIALARWYGQVTSAGPEATLAGRLLERRSFLYAGSWQANVEVTSAGCYRVFAGDILVREGSALPGATPGCQPGSVDALQWIQRRDRVCAVYRGAEMVAVESCIQKDTDTELALARLLDQRDAGMKWLVRKDQILAEVIAESAASIMVGHIERQLDRIVESAALPVALSAVPDSLVPVVRERMRETGLYSFFDFDRQLIEGVALLGCVCSSGLSSMESFVRSFFEERGYNFDSIVAAIDSVEAECGIIRLGRGGGMLLPSI